MRIWNAVIAALLLALHAAAVAIDVDITNDPNKEFLFGYRHKYPGDCDVVWWASRWNTQHIMGIGECKGITAERVYDDAIDMMNRVKASGTFGSFHEYFEDGDRIAREHTTAETLEMEKIPRRCLDTASGTYFFLPAKAHNRPGWFYLDKLHNGGSLDLSTIGFWKETAGGGIIADFGLSTVSVSMDIVYPC